MSADRRFRSERHQSLEATHPGDPASRSWERPSQRFAACQNGPCAQGRKLCPSPQACLLEERAAAARSLARPALLIALVVCLGFAIATVFLP